MREIESFQSDRVSQEWLAGLDAAEAQGFKDSAAGLKCLPRKHGFYGTGITLYQRGWKAGLSARSVSVAK
jgi:ribosome modulation factor